MARKTGVLVLFMMLLLTGCGVTFKDKAALKAAEKDAVQYYSDKYSEKAKVTSAEFYSHPAGGVGLPTYTEYNTDLYIYTLDNGVTVIYDKEKNCFFDDKQAGTISADIAKKVWTSIVESTGWDYKLICPGDAEEIRFTQCFARQAFHAYYDGDIIEYIEDADDIFNYGFYKLYFRTDGEYEWESTLEKFRNDMDAINGLRGAECFGVKSLEENVIEDVSNSLWAYNESAKLPLSVTNSFPVGEVRVYFKTFGKGLTEADRDAVFIEDVSSLITTYNSRLDGYRMQEDGTLYRVRINTDFSRYEITWDYVTMNFVYRDKENIFAFKEEADKTLRTARYSYQTDNEYFPLDCGNEFYIYVGEFER